MMTNIVKDHPAEGSNHPTSVQPSANMHIAPMIKNQHGYPPFDLCHVPTYTNNQLHYYHISGAMLNVNKVELKEQMDDQKAALELINWDGNA
jgi:hypothetical protein